MGVGAVIETDYITLQLLISWLDDGSPRAEIPAARLWDAAQELYPDADSIVIRYGHMDLREDEVWA